MYPDSDHPTFTPYPPHPGRDHGAEIVCAYCGAEVKDVGSWADPGDIVCAGCFRSKLLEYLAEIASALRVIGGF